MMSFLDSMVEPLLRVDVAGVAAGAVALSSEGPAYATSGATVHSTWQGLAGVYDAPEAATLFAATLPIQETAAVLGEEVLTVSTALAVFTAEVRKLQEEARALIAEATALEAWAAEVTPDIALAGGDITYGFGQQSPEGDRLTEAAAAVMARFNQAEITCANKIRPLAGGVPLVANNGDDVLTDNEYGLTADQWIDTWGGLSLNRTVGGGIATAFWGGVEGVVSLATFDGDAWLGLWRATASSGLAYTGQLWINDYVDLPGLPVGAARQTLLDTGKGMLAWDEWSRNPANAFGQILFNFGTLALAGGAVGAGGRLGGAARTGLGAVTGATRVRIGDLARAAGTSLADLRIPTIHLNPSLAPAGGGRIGLPDVSVGSHRLGDTGPGRILPDRPMAMPNITDPPSFRGGDSTPPDVTPNRPDADHTPDTDTLDTDAAADSARPDTDRPSVWDDMKATQENYPGSELPRSFELTAGDTRVWVNGNASEHIAEFISGMARRGATKAQVELVTQAQLSSLRSAVAAAGRDGLIYGRIINIGGWELMFGAARQAGQLPALIHALYRG
jgi:hypothetical protein